LNKMCVLFRPATTLWILRALRFKPMPLSCDFRFLWAQTHGLWYEYRVADSDYIWKRINKVSQVGQHYFAPQHDSHKSCNIPPNCQLQRSQI
jgi:hypothetical protein